MADAPEAAKPQSIIPTIEILETDLRCIESSFYSTRKFSEG